MKLKIIIFFLSILFSSSVFSQKKEYKEIKFTNLNPVWLYSPIDSTLIGEDDFTGRNHFNNSYDIPIPHYIDDNYLYIAHHTMYSTDDVEGALLEKIDILTGKTIWQQSWDLRNNDRQEWVESIVKNTLGELVVTTARRVKVNDNESSGKFAIFGDTCLINIRKFSAYDGSLIKQVKTDTSDKESLRIRNSGIIFKTVLYHVDENKFQYYSLSAFHDILSSYELDSKGHQLSNVHSDTLKEVDISNYDIQFDRNMFKVSEDTLVMLDFYFDKHNPEVDTQTIIKIYNKKLNITNRFKIDSLLNYNYKRLYLVFANHDYILIRGNKKADSSNIGSIFYIILNYKGSVERQFTAVYNGKKHFFYLPLKLNEEKEYLFTTQNNHFYGLDFVRTTSTDSVKVIGEFYYEDIDYGYSPLQLWQLKNGDILSYGFTSYYDDGAYVRICPTIMRIKAEDLGIKSTSTIELAQQYEKLLLSPNPAKDILKVQSDNIKINRMTVYDIFGRLTINKSFPDNNTQLINIGKIMSGIYFIKAYSANGLVELGKFVKE